MLDSLLSKVGSVRYWEVVIIHYYYYWLLSCYYSCGVFVYKQSFFCRYYCSLCWKFCCGTLRSIIEEKTVSRLSADLP